MFADMSHYFDWCSIVEKRWRLAVNRSAKTVEVNRKLELWHRKNEASAPAPPVNLAKRRIERARKRV